MRAPSVAAAALVLCLAGVAFAAGDIEGFIGSLERETGDRQLNAAIVLGDYNTPEVIAALSKALDDKQVDMNVRAACARSLGRLRASTAYQMVEALAGKGAEKAIVRQACARAMAAIKGTESIDSLITLLKAEKSPVVKEALIQALGSIQDRKVSAAVAPLLKDDATAPLAIRVLGSLGDPSAIPTLAAELKTDRPTVRQAVIKTLGEINSADAVPPLLDCYPSANDAEKVLIIASLNTHGDPRSFPLLIKELQDPKVYPAVRRRAALALGSMVAQEAIEPLVKIILNTAEDNGLRLTCIQALANYSERDDYAIAGLIGVMADKRMAEPAALALSRITRRYFGTDKTKWETWFHQWRQERDKSGAPVAH